MEKLAAWFPARSNLASVTPLKVVTLASNNDTDNLNSCDCNGPLTYSHFFPLAVFGLFGFFLFMCVVSIYASRRRTNWDGRGAHGNDHIIMEVVNREPVRGVERAIIESFPVFSYNIVKGLIAQVKCSDCAICLSNFAEDEMLRLLPKCRHAFHPECIDKWLFTHTTCPVCRTSLVLSDDSIPTATDFCLVEPQASPEEVMIVINNGTEDSFRRNISNDEASSGPSGCDSMGYSLVRVRKEIEQPTEWCIARAQGLTPGLHRSCSFLGAHLSHDRPDSNNLPAHSKSGGLVGNVGHRSRSERWGRISKNSALVLRTLSERISPQATGQVGIEEQKDKTYLKRTFSWLGRIDREADRTARSQIGSVSDRNADQSGVCSGESKV